MKCAFGKTEVEFLGHRLGVVGISPPPTKTEAIIQSPVHNNMKSLWQFFGMVNFYRRFIPNCTGIPQSLANLLTNTKRCDIVVSGDTLSAFSKIKAALAKTVELSHVLPDVELCLAVDDSAVGVGAVLQKVSGSWKPISFFPKSWLEPRRDTAPLEENCMLLTQLFITSGIFWRGDDFTSSPTTNHL